MKHIFIKLFVIAMGSIFTSVSFAQLEEIVVTAQKREESLQDVPISIQAVTGEAIFESGYSDMQEVAQFIPNLHMRDGFVGQEITVRGVGTAAANEAFEQAVAQFHDGVYYGRDNLGQNAFFDLERVEVVKGPAPIFAGQSATAGALSYYSKRPGDEYEGFVSASYGDDEELKFEGAYGGPITDTLGVRVSGTYYELGDAGFEDTRGIPQGVKENYAIRGLAVWNPTDNFEATFKYEYHDVFQRGIGGEYTRCELRPEFSDANPGLGAGLPAACALETLVTGVDLNTLDGVLGIGGSQDAGIATDMLNASIPAGMPLFGGDGGTVNNHALGLGPAAMFQMGLTGSREMNENEDRDQQVHVASALLDYQWGDYLLTSQTAYVSYNKNDWLDPDRTSFAIFSDERLEYFDQISQEFRVASSTDQTISWIWSGYYQKHYLDTSINIFAGVGPPGMAISFGGTLVEESEWKSTYIATTTNLLDNLRLNVGIRYQNIKKTGILTPTLAFFTPADGDTEYNATYAGPATVIPAGHYSDGDRFVGGPPQFGRVRSVEWLPEAGFQWDMTEDAMFYFKYSEALKAGGFVMSPAPGGMLPDPFTFNNESADGIEAGIKSRLLGNTLQFNISYYDTNFEDLQLTIFRSEDATFITQNAGAAHTMGVEFDGVWAANDWFQLGFSGHVGEAEFDSYPAADCNSFEAKQAGGVACTADRAGVALPDAQDWSIALRPEFNWGYGDFLLRLGADVAISPSFEFDFDQDPANTIPSYQRIDLRGSITPASEQWELALYVRDVTDAKVRWSGQTDFQSKSLGQGVHDADGAIYDRGRRFGVQGRWNFN